LLSSQPLHISTRFPATESPPQPPPHIALEMAEKEKQEDYRVEIGNDKRPYSPVRGSTPHAPSPPAGPSMAIASYCVASILMTLTNKFVLSGIDFNLNFMLLAIQVSSGISSV